MTAAKYLKSGALSYLLYPIYGIIIVNHFDLMLFTNYKNFNATKQKETPCLECILMILYSQHTFNDFTVSEFKD